MRFATAVLTFISGAATESTSSSGFIRATATVKNGSECSFTNGFVAQDSHLDAGVLGCGMGETCVEDSSSSLGGRCIESRQRQLGAPENAPKDCEFANGTLGVKCSDFGACYGVNPDNVGCGSCIGRGSCWSMTGTVGESSCIGDSACSYSSGSMGENSCIGKQSCANMNCELIVMFRCLPRAVPLTRCELTLLILQTMWAQTVGKSIGNLMVNPVLIRSLCSTIVMTSMHAIVQVLPLAVVHGTHSIF